MRRICIHAGRSFRGGYYYPQVCRVAPGINHAGFNHLIAGVVFGWEMALYAFVTLFMWGLVADYVLEGPSVVRTAFIVTDEPENVSQALQMKNSGKIANQSVPNNID